MYQGMFAIITVALITGAIAERMKFTAYVVFTALWAMLVYSPLAHWVWGGRLAVQAAARSTSRAAPSSTSPRRLPHSPCAIVLGKRRDYGTTRSSPHNLPMTVLGAGILWFGWFGFNAGSALAPTASPARVHEHAPRGRRRGMLTWLLVEGLQPASRRRSARRPAPSPASSAITPAAGFVDAVAAMLIGLSPASSATSALMLKSGSASTTRSTSSASTASAVRSAPCSPACSPRTAVNAAGANGLLYGNPAQVVSQLVGVVATWAFSFVVSFVHPQGHRRRSWACASTPRPRDAGLDLAEHAEEGYILVADAVHRRPAERHDRRGGDA